MYLRGTVYYHVAYKGGKKVWTRLSQDYADALALWARIEAYKGAAGTMSEAINRYRLEIVPGLAAGSMPEYHRILGLLDHVFGSVMASSIRPSDIARYLDRRSAKVAANREIAVLSSVFAYAIRWGLAHNNPCRDVRRNTEKARKRHVDDDEVRALWAVADEQWRLIIDLALITGLRRSDLMALTLDNTHSGIILETRKTGCRIHIESTPYLDALLAKIKLLRRRNHERHLFCTRSGSPYTVSGWNSSWRRIVERSRVEDIHFHDLRARAITDAKNIGGRDYAQSLATHANGSMTETYIRGREHLKVKPLR